MWLSSSEAIARLGVKKETLYSYVSRGLIRSEPGEGRQHRFRRDDVERLAKQGRKTRRGADSRVVVESAVSVVEDGRLLYRGIDATELAGSQPFEAVSSMLWDAPHDPAAWATPVAWRKPLATTWSASPPSALPLDRLMLAGATMAAIDGHRPPGDRDALAQGAARFVSALADSLGSPPRGGHRPGSGGSGPPIATRVARNLAGRRPPTKLVRLVDSALVLVADHGLATPTLAARLVASVGGDLYTSALAGCCAMRGSAPGAAALAVERLLRESALGDPARVVDERVGQPAPVPGVGHPLYPGHDPRAAYLLAELQSAYEDAPAMAVVRRLADALAAVGQPAPNIDFALGALSYVAELRPGASEAIFTLGRMAGFVAHCIEQYGSGTRYRLNAVYVGPGPAAPVSAVDT